MRDITTLFREFARLDLLRLGPGLSVAEHERWAKLQAVLDRTLGHSDAAEGSKKRRSAKRVASRINCSYANGRDRRDGVVTNLSTGGVFIRTDWPLPIDSEVRLFIRLEDTGREISVRGTVVSNNVDANFDINARGMGVRFVCVDVEVVDRLSELYSNELARDTKRLVRKQ